MDERLPRPRQQSVQKGFPQRQISGSTNLTGKISGEAMHYFPHPFAKEHRGAK
jgi:hypothetical protein